VIFLFFFLRVGFNKYINHCLFLYFYCLYLQGSKCYIRNFN